MKNTSAVYKALENIIEQAGLTPLFTYAEAAALPHVAAAFICEDCILVQSKQIAANCYGHPKMSVQARLVDGAWMLWGDKNGKIVPLALGVLS